MSDEVTYATLAFQDSSGARNSQDGNSLRKRGRPAPSRAWPWRRGALALLLLCLLQLLGLLTLGILFLQMSNKMSSDSEKLSQLQTVIHQQDNLSKQLSFYRNLPMEEKLLRSQLSSLLETQRQMAIRLCRELITHTSDHRCNPCPKMWQWYQKSCYYFTVNEEKTWSDSREDCEKKNSTLLEIQSEEEKDFLRSQTLARSSFFWLGLSWRPSGENWLWEDGSIPSPSLFSDKELAQFNESRGCAYLQRGALYVSRCSAEISWICEKTAAVVKIEDLD